MPDHDHLCEDCKRTLARYARERTTARQDTLDLIREVFAATHHTRSDITYSGLDLRLWLDTLETE